MQSKIKNYELTVTTLSPLHVGSGDRINKKEYIYQKNENKAYIPDLKKMFSGLKKLNLLREYEKYLLGNGGDLFFWLEKELKIKKLSELKPILYYFNHKIMKGNIYVPENEYISRGASLFDEFFSIKYEDLDNYLKEVSEDKEIVEIFDNLYKKIRFDK